MKRFFVFSVLLVAELCLLTPVAAGANRQQDFAIWLNGVRREARAAGISKSTLETALRGIDAPSPRVVALDRNQPECTLSFTDYVTAQVSRDRIAAGRRMLRHYRTWLGRLERRYGVQRRYIVALWGIETDYGVRAGHFPVIRALATLAYDGRRSAYFRKELIEALRILDAGHMRLSAMRGSWAGAMGQCQFMPSSFRRFAVDADGNGRIDIRHSVPDVLASIANFLAHTGWRRDQIWGRPVRVPEDFDRSLAGLATRLPLERWQSLGVRRTSGSALPRRNLDASLLLPSGPDGPAFLVYGNFRRLLDWNHSNAFAVAVGTLAERLKTSR